MRRAFFLTELAGFIVLGLHRALRAAIFLPKRVFAMRVWRAAQEKEGPQGHDAAV